jgi:hypothetical protein
MLWLMNMGLAASRGAAPPPVVISAPTPAGKSRKRYYVEIDSVRFDVKDAEEAREILERAKRLANKAAEVSAEVMERAHRYTTETIEPVKLEAPRIKASPELKLPLKSVRRSMNRIYRENSINLELRLWLELERRLLEDDDEAMLLLQ